MRGHQKAWPARGLNQGRGLDVPPSGWKWVGSFLECQRASPCALSPRLPHQIPNSKTLLWRWDRRMEWGQAHSTTLSHSLLGPGPQVSKQHSEWQNQLPSYQPTTIGTPSLVRTYRKWPLSEVSKFSGNVLWEPILYLIFTIVENLARLLKFGSWLFIH